MILLAPFNSLESLFWVWN